MPSFLKRIDLVSFAAGFAAGRVVAFVNHSSVRSLLSTVDGIAAPLAGFINGILPKDKE